MSEHANATAGVPCSVVHQELIFTSTPHFPRCHASTIEMLPSGRFISAWFGGTDEGYDDVAIWASIEEDLKWSEPFEVVRHPGIPTWNPVLFIADADGKKDRLHLFYRVGKTIPGWRSYVTVSDDEGQTWSDPEPMPDGILGPIKNKPILLSDGSWLAGSSVETEDEWYCVIEHSSDQGRTWTSSNKLSFPGQPKGLIQPTLWESSPGIVHALLRSRDIGYVCRTDSEDGGRTWSTPYLTDLVHNNSGVDVAVMTVTGNRESGKDTTEAGQTLALVHNPVQSGRTPIRLSFSVDNGQTWPEYITLESSPGEYSYPAIIDTPRGLAITYTYNRDQIMFVLCQ